MDYKEFFFSMNMDDKEYVMARSTNLNMLKGIHSSSITITIPANIQPRLHMSNE